MVRPERRVVLAGESPVRVSAGAPGSRLRSQGEIRAARRSVESPCKRGEQISGLQQGVNAIASTDYQPKGVWESRAAHVTALGNRQHSGPERMLDSSRGPRRRRVEKEQGGTGETLPGSLVGQGPSI